MNSTKLFPTLKELTLNCIASYSAATGTVEKTIGEGENKLPGELMHELLEVLVGPLMLAVAQGDINKTEALILERSPLLLSAKGKAVDYSRRTIEGLTPFQVALCAWDDEMCEVLKKYMINAEVIREYKEIFPEGHEQHYEAQMPFDFSALVGVITQSNNADVEAQLNLQQNDSLLCQAFNQFRDDFTLRSQQEIVFNPKHLISACAVYNENFERWDWNRRDLFGRQVIGYVQRFLPANIAQDVAQGLYYRVEEKEKANRSFNFKLGDVGAIFPSRVILFRVWDLIMPVRWVGMGRCMATKYKMITHNLCRAKTPSLQNLSCHTH